MRKKLINKYCFIQPLVWVLLFFHHSQLAADKFGYISYMTTNIGDDFQAIAAKRFLPPDSIPIDREFIGSFENDSVVHTIVNGWYMHTKDIDWYRPDMQPPEKSWPPSSCIDPLLLSIYFWDEFEPVVFSEESLEYLKQHAPIGARDYTTLEKLQSHNIPSYFSGCLTLTLDNPYQGKRKDVIYAVDVTKKTLDFIKRNTRCKVIEVTHGVPEELFFENNPNKRLAYGNTLLKKYQRAKCIVTERLHAAMPCLAFQTPVLFISPPGKARIHGLRELTWHCSQEELISGKYHYDFDNPPENPKDYLILREQLLDRVNNWVKETRQSFEPT